MNSKNRRYVKNRGQPFPLLLSGLTARQSENLNLQIRALVGGVIGLVLTLLFSIITLAVVGTAIASRQPESFQLLNTVLTVVGSGLGGVLGYFLGRSSKPKGD